MKVSNVVKLCDVGNQNIVPSLLRIYYNLFKAPKTGTKWFIFM